MTRDSDGRKGWGEEIRPDRVDDGDLETRWMLVNKGVATTLRTTARFRTLLGRIGGVLCWKRDLGADPETECGERDLIEWGGTSF